MRTSFTIEHPPMGAPRQTISDKWNKRPCVMRARAFADAARLAATGSTTGYVEADVLALYVFAHFEMPKSWGKQKRAEMAGKLHRQKPDADNVQKLVMDSLLREDKSVPIVQCVKFWCEEGFSARVDVFLLVL